MGITGMANLLSVLNVVLAVLMCVLPAAGIVVTAMARRNHGRAATLGLLGCVALLLGEALGLGQVLFLDAFRGSLGAGGTLTMFFVLRLITFVFAATGIGLLIWAVVARRTPRPAAGPGRQPPVQQPNPAVPYPNAAGPYPNPAGPYPHPQHNPQPSPQHNPQPSPQQSWQQPPA